MTESAPLTIELASVVGAGNRLSIPTPAGNVELSLDKLTDGSGYIGVGGGETALRDIAVRELIASATLPLPEALSLAIEKAELGQISLTGTARQVLEGVIGCERIASDKVSLSGPAVSLRTSLVASELKSVLGADSGDARFQELALGIAELSAGGLTLGGELELREFAAEWRPAASESPMTAPIVSIAAGSASAPRLRVAREGLSLQVTGLEAPGGFRFDGSALTFPELRCERLAAVCTLPRPGASPAGAIPAADFALDYGFLDGIGGQLDVDLRVAASLPVVGMRRATHKFRIPIVGGIVNYREVERDLADLEDAFIDITLRGQKLVIERDIPLLPGFEKPMVSWALDEEGVSLARKHLVRLRTLPHYRIVDAGGDKKSKIKLHALGFEELAVALSIDEGRVLSAPGGGLAARIEHLGVRGSLDYDTERETAPTQIDFEARRVELSARALALAGVTVDSADLVVGAVDSANIAFEGLVPRELELTLLDVTLKNVAITLPSPRGAPPMES